MSKTWCDLKTDEEKCNFIRSGEAYAAGILSPEMEEEISKRFDNQEFIPREKVLIIVDACFHAYASHYRTDASNMAEDIISSLGEQSCKK